jgi:RimJ/RimL family protein N-acetyltransferase
MFRKGYVLRPWANEDASPLSRILSSKKFWEFLPEEYSGEVSSDEALELIKLNVSNSNHYIRAVEFEDKLIGQVRLEFNQEYAELSYWLDITHWGYGHGSAMVTLFLYESSRHYPELRFVYARVHEKNLASARILTKLGFMRFAAKDDRPFQYFECSMTKST